ncbi:hypothetical protein GOODEAATRI_025524, partial [Goodea atripinnis]
RYNVGCTKRVGLFRPEKNKTTNRWRKRSHGRSSIEAKKQVKRPISAWRFYILAACLSAQSGGVQPLFRHVPAHRQPSRSSELEGCDGRDAPSLDERFLPNDPGNWNVEEVYEFIRSLPGWCLSREIQKVLHSGIMFYCLSLLSGPGCQEIADEFRSQEIDGQALLLLKEDHLMSTMNIKLGPALKIFARINMLKDS